MIGKRRKGRPRKVRNPVEVDEIEDMDDLPAATGRPPRPMKEVYLSIIQGVVARRAGTLNQQVDALLAKHFPTVKTARAMDAIKTWLLNPARSRMPTEETFAPKPKRTSRKKR